MEFCTTYGEEKNSEVTPHSSSLGEIYSNQQ